MGIKFQFDANDNPIIPTLILASHSGKKYGLIAHPYQLNLVGSLMECPELSFTVNKDEEPLWDKILDFKLIYVVEWDTWLEIHVGLTDGNCTSKSITANGICKSELSQTLLHGLEFNTDEDIALDDYKRRLIYDPWDKDCSILTMITEKVPHYTIKHVDSSVASLFKVFAFDAVSIDDAILEICTECHAIPVYNDGSDPETGMPLREISIYDLETVCNTCGHRGEFSDVCPECGSTDLKYGYGKDTTIYVSKDNLTEEVQYSTDVDSVKNTFKLVAGDEIMTAAIRACNPNGTDYIQYLNQETREDMPKELVNKIDEYDNLYKYYQKENVVNLDSEIVDDYNNLVDKYKPYNEDLAYVSRTLKGYSALMNAVYDVIDFELYLESGLMPADEIDDTTVAEEVAKLTQDNLSPIGLDMSYDFTKSIIDPMVLSVARYIVDKRFDLRIKTSVVNTYGNVTYWVGVFTVTDYSDETQTLDSDEITLIINKDTDTYIKQRVNKVLVATKDEKDYSINKLLTPDTSIENFRQAIILFNSGVLQSLKDTCMTCLDTIQSKGMATADNTYYSNYRNKLDVVMDEIVAKENEISNIIGVLKDYIVNARNEIQDSLNFENYLGEDLYKIFCSYRREDIYQNEYYISDGLNNQQIFENAREFYETAEKEIYKSAVLQHSISATLKNLLVIPEFAPLRNYFELGNWLRINVDGDVFRLRLIRYEINFDELQDVAVEFSDVTKTAEGVLDIENLLNRTSSMASSYGAVVTQINATAATRTTVQDWIKNGFDATLTKIVDDGGRQDVVVDNHGILIREYDEITETYHDTQMKFINSVLAITDDNWKTIRTALGNYVYQDPVSGLYKEAYGLIAETIIGNLILGKTLRIHNESNNLVFDEDGLFIYNDVNSFVVNPNSDRLVRISKYNQDMLWVDASGMLHIEGDGAGLDIKNNSSILGLSTEFKVTAGDIRGEIANETTSLRTILSQTADSIRMEVSNTSMTLSSQFEVTINEIRSEVSNGVSELYTRISQTADEIRLEASQLDESLRMTLSISLAGIRTEVSDFEREITSTLLQKEDLIRAEINDAKNGLMTSFELTLNKIESEVRNNTTNMYTTITQTENEIKSLVANEMNKMRSVIDQKEDSIMMYVINETNGVRTSIEVASDRIDLLVGETTSLSLALDAIVASVGESSITLTNSMITAIAGQAISAIADQINLNGLVTINGLDSSLQSMITGIGDHAVYYSSTAPTGVTLYNGDVWYQEYTDEDTNNVHMKMYVYTNNQWVEKSNGQVVIANGTIGTDLLAATSVTAEKMSTDAIKSRNFPTTAPTDGSNYSTAGTFLNLLDGTITSKNFRIDSLGDVHIKGNLDAGSVGDLYITDGELYGYLDNTTKFFVIGSAYPMVVNESINSTCYWLDWDGKVTCNGINAKRHSQQAGGTISEFDSIKCTGFAINDTYITDDIILANGTPASGATSYSFKNSGGTITYSVAASNHSHNYAASTHYHSKITNKTNGTVDDGIDFKVGQYTDPDTHKTENVYWANEGYIRVGNYGIASSSDERLKNIISRFDNRHKQLFMNIEPIVFTWKDEFKGEKMPHDNLIHWGLSAQEMLSASKENGLSKECDIVVGSEKSEFSVRYQEVEMLAWYVTQENVRDIESLQKELEDVKNENDSLKKRISALENAIIIK